MRGHFLPATSGTQREVHQDQQTSRMHATAVVDDKRGHKKKETQRPQDPRLSNHIEKFPILPKPSTS